MKHQDIKNGWMTKTENRKTLTKAINDSGRYIQKLLLKFTGHSYITTEYHQHPGKVRKVWFKAYTKPKTEKKTDVQYRTDINSRETKVSFWGLSLYRYSKPTGINKSKISYRLIKHPNPKYLNEAIFTNVYVGRKQFKEQYGGNKWIVPINYILDLNLP